MLELREFNFTRIRFFTLPGKFHGFHWSPDAGRISDLIKVIDSKSERKQPYLVDIWNASGISGAARLVRDALLNAGFNVVEWGNYSVRQEKTTITNMTSEVDPSGIIQSRIGCGQIINRFESNRNVDFTIIIGNDFKESYLLKDSK